MKKDWEIKSFEDCIENVKYTTKIPSKDYKQEGAFPIVSQEEELISGYWDNESDLFSLTKPVVIFGDHTRVLKYVDFDFVLGADGVKILQPKDFLDTKFFMYFLSNANIKHLGYARHYRLLKELNVFVPPLEEQKRIVKILDEKFAQLETIKANAQNNLQNAKDLFQSQLTKAFSNTTWEKKRLGDCGTFKNGMNFAATDSGYTIRSLGVGDFKDHYSIDNTETLSEISLKAAPAEDYLLHDGDIVFVRSNGNKELVGRCLLVYPKDIPTTYSGFCIRFRKDFDLLDADFLLHFMKAESSRKILNGKEGANISNLNQKILGDFEVPLPPLPEQKRIVKELDTLSEKIKALQNIYEQMLLDCNELKQSFLSKAFAGEL